MTNKEEFNLSEKIMGGVSVDHLTGEDIPHWLLAKDVKEFIKLLKWEIHEGLRNLEGLKVTKRIDKLAGDKLK